MAATVDGATTDFRSESRADRLASDAASYITGTTIFIDGGLMHQTGAL